MRFLVWLHTKLTAFLARRNAIDPEPVYLPHPDLTATPDDAESDVELPAAILDALRSYHDRPVSTPVTSRELDNRPQVMPPSDTQYVVWSRGHVVCATDSGREAASVFSKASTRAGIHQFWDRAHHASVPVGLRVERVNPLSASE